MAFIFNTLLRKIKIKNQDSIVLVEMEENQLR